MKNVAREPISLETPVGEEEDSLLSDFIEDKDVENPATQTSFALLQEELKEVLDTLKSPRKSASTLLQTYYEDWVKMGFSQVAILCACEYTLNSGYHSYKKVNELLRFCYSKGIISNRDVAEKLKFRSAEES